MNLVIRDDVFGEEVARANQAWPGNDWPGWIHYAESYHHKTASNVTNDIPKEIGTLLAKMAALSVSNWIGEPVIPDLSLHGAGLHVIKPGGLIGPHLDANTHRRLGIERVLSMVLWVHDRWESHDGGQLVIGDTEVVPRSGRLVVFDCRNQTHEVRRVLCKRDRRSLALFWYSTRIGDGARMRAYFEAT